MSPTPSPSPSPSPYSWAQDEVWGYCDIGAPTPAGSCPARNRIVEHNHTLLSLGEWRGASLYESRYDYYAVELPANLDGFQIVVVPLTAGGNPNLFVSFDVPFPTGHAYTYKQDETDGVEVFYMTSATYGYCGLNHTEGAGCTLFLSVTVRPPVATLGTCPPIASAIARLRPVPPRRLRGRAHTRAPAHTPARSAGVRVDRVHAGGPRHRVAKWHSVCGGLRVEADWRRRVPAAVQRQRVLRRPRRLRGAAERRPEL